MIAKLCEYQEQGFYVILFSPRNMNTFDANVGRVAAVTGRQMMEWLDHHNIPYDELHLGQPWLGLVCFYVDDKAIRPEEFLKMSYK